MSSPPNRSCDLFHHRFDLLRIGHVAFDHERIFQFLRDGFGVRFVLSGGIGDVVNDAFRAALPNALIISAPMPRELPVTSTTLPVKSRWIGHNRRDR